MAESGDTCVTISLCVHPEEARNYVRIAKRDGRKVGVVPTMGSLHQGHLSLVKASNKECDVTVVTVFVNPTQFGPGEDFDKYPRDLDRDSAMLFEMGVDMVYAPNAEDVYRPEHSTFILPPKVGDPLEGHHRPGHFQGVTTVVFKLLQIVPADVAFFGQKDFQQVRVIQDMCTDLDLPVSIQVCPTIRESDGIALSSRNAYLSDTERLRALSLSEALKLAVSMSRKEKPVAEDIKTAMLELLQAAPVDSVDYVAVVDPKTLQPVEKVTPGTMALVAAYVGNTRLIDNARLG